ncbi:uncharacterized protein [Physcomitrium patens]|uniref:uncharacterized protein isoform X2 n=1 Tax=Physcomitrium patens TaxID=3218 RepID=UPI000D16C9C3|nr:protein PHR1-LIKE 3-like isoform X2 [Physcomitrium patens]|eukprot:XP_024371021.1 protein PHR1-LIKE 3-like isoform X2 [Physcomitrella patens]
MSIFSFNPERQRQEVELSRRQAQEATPKSVMRVMGVKGLTLYHLKSHLQKYRLGKQLHRDSRVHEANKDGSHESSDMQGTSNGTSDGTLTPTSQNPQDNIQIPEAMRLQMEIQCRLHEQLEVQRELQLRIEAQGKYLQTILEKAKETLAGHTSTSPHVKAAHDELTELASKVISDPGTFEVTLPQHLAGLNPPQLSNHASDSMQVVSNRVQDVTSPSLPGLQSGRTSDTSSPKSQLTTFQEDSGGVSGGGEQPTVPGGNSNTGNQMQLSAGGNSSSNNDEVDDDHGPRLAISATEFGASAGPGVPPERPTPRRGAIPIRFTDSQKNNNDNRFHSNVIAASFPLQQRMSSTVNAEGALDLNHGDHHHSHTNSSNSNGNSIQPERDGDLDLNAVGWER